jgi:two-component system cell cycle sensor histidine kinase/response regulator CckA
MSQPAPAPDTPSPRPDHWVLVVDDEAPVRMLLSEALSQFDCEVLVAETAEAGLEIIASRPTEPLLVLADVVMPGMDGLTLARRLQEQLRHGRIVLMSGHLADTSWWPTDLRELAFLPKPFALAGLGQLVEEARLNYPAAR